MNAMLASGGYNWTVIHLESRSKYMKALESVSIGRISGPLQTLWSQKWKFLPEAQVQDQHRRNKRAELFRP